MCLGILLPHRIRFSWMKLKNQQEGKFPNLKLLKLMIWTHQPGPKHFAALVKYGAALVI